LGGFFFWKSISFLIISYGLLVSCFLVRRVRNSVMMQTAMCKRGYMGLGHQRAAIPLRFMAEKIILTANNMSATLPDEQKL
jgi:hypothetical protein